ncbi:MAG TPA: PhnD/SsuA/transferrin family substrate-binding protein [Anaerolineales bacterium]|nr:PhnD/SsuA/transferrin family substrate-binding protein [Anaerolineales bacterium]
MNRRSSLLISFLLIAAFVLADCTLPRLGVTDVPQPTETGTVTPTPEVTPTYTALSPLPAAELGLAENPLILTLPPSANSQAQIDAAKVIASQFTERTGYTVVTVIPDSEATLVEALGRGNAHIVLLDPYAYELAYQRGWVRASYAVLKDGEGRYGAQFIAARKGGFESYFNESTELNMADAKTALAQFNDKKPCWSDGTSPSGYIIPAGYLNENQVIIRPPAFVQGHPTVVRSLYASGICDFGATYIDARKFPSLEDEFPDLIEQVIVVWRIPDIIPYDVLAFSTNMPQEMRDILANSIPAMMQTTAGKAAFKTLYDIEELQAVNDGYYDEFRTYVNQSGVDLITLVK